MKRSVDILLPRALLSIQQMNLRPVLAMVYCEGSIEYRETANMNVISRDANDQISSMAQIGLYFPRSRFCKSHKEAPIPIPATQSSNLKICSHIS